MALHRHRRHPGHGTPTGRRRVRVRLYRARRQRPVLDGGKTYRLHVDPNPPAKNFWALDVYDTQTRSLLQVPSTIYPAVASNSGDLQANEDGSYDLYFGPNAPEGKESNWVETIPGKCWFQLFRLYGPLQPWFDQTWKLNEFEPLDWPDQPASPPRRNTTP
jgi:hypothetical protein